MAPTSIVDPHSESRFCCSQYLIHKRIPMQHGQCRLYVSNVTLIFNLFDSSVGTCTLISVFVYLILMASLRYHHGKHRSTPWPLFELVSYLRAQIWKHLRNVPGEIGAGVQKESSYRSTSFETDCWRSWVMLDGSQRKKGEPPLCIPVLVIAFTD